jgi:hypothetical protein
MFAIVKLILALATSKQGRKALRRLAAYLDSDDGRRLIAQTRKVATGPEAQRIARQVKSLLRDAAERTRTVRVRRRQPAPPRSRLASAAERARQRARSVRASR